MIAVIQRVCSGSVSLGNKAVSQIDKGLVVLAGIERDDTEETVRKVAVKIMSMRIFEDAQGRMNLSVMDTAGSVLCVSQFTLCADLYSGRRPSFSLAMPSEKAGEIFGCFVGAFREKGVKTGEGVFGEHMTVNIVNDGPVTFIIESGKL